MLQTAQAFFFKIKNQINCLPIPYILISLFVFFLPFQKAYSRYIEKLSKFAFSKQVMPSCFLNSQLRYYITDFLLLALFLFGLYIGRKKWREIFWTQSQKYLCIFVMISFLSILSSSAASNLWPYWNWVQFALPIGGYFIFSTLDFKKALALCFWIILGTSLFESLVVILQYISQQSIHLKYLGEPSQYFYCSPFIEMEHPQRWIFDWLFHTAPPSTCILRPSGTFLHPNSLGGFMGMAIFASSFLFLETKKKWLAPVICLQIFTLFLTYSRGAIFGVALCSTGLSLLLYRQGGKRLFFIFLIGALFSLAILKDPLLARGGILNYNVVAKRSDTSRIYYQNIAWEMIKTRPLTGHGLGQFSIEMARFEKDNSPYLQKVHNIYLLVLVETGVFGLLTFVAFTFSLLYWGWKKGIDQASATLMMTWIFFLLSGMIDLFWLDHEQGRHMFFLIAALLAAYVLKLPKIESQPAEVLLRG